MDEHRLPPEGAVGIFEQLAIGQASGTLGWVLQGYPNERIDRSLIPDAVHHWGDARSRGKVPGQPVLFLQAHPRDPRWVGWGRVVEPEERWRVLGVTVRCAEVLRPALPVQAPRSIPPALSEASATPPGHDWEFRELGHVLGLATHRERTPYLDMDARDLRLGSRDLGFLLHLQPGLRRLGRGERG